LIIINEFVHAFGVKGHPNNLRLIDSFQYIF
jgi:MFS superfamily sulfate permease-like transporter